MEKDRTIRTDLRRMKDGTSVFEIQIENELVCITQSSFMPRVEISIHGFTTKTIRELANQIEELAHQSESEETNQDEIDRIANTAGRL